MASSKLLKLNLGAGLNRMEGFVNIDVEKSCNPDLVCNFINSKLPYKDCTVDEVVLFHTIEHIGKNFHGRVLMEIWRVLKPGATFIVSYPEFLKCVDRWKHNKNGKRGFWEATIYGRQLYPSDFHVSLMHTPHFVEVLRDCGFVNIKTKAEPVEIYNTFVTCSKGAKVAKYEDLIAQDMDTFSFNKVRKLKA